MFSSIQIPQNRRAVSPIAIAAAFFACVAVLALSPSTALADASPTKVGGLFWAEGTVGYGRINATKFNSRVTSRFAGQQLEYDLPDVIRKGPQYTVAAGFRAGSVLLGARFRQSDYDDFKVQQVGLNFDFMIRAVPYIHPYIRLGIDYARYTDMPAEFRDRLAQSGATVENFRNKGGAVTLGLGFRARLARFVSLSAGCDVAAIGSKVDAELVMGENRQKVEAGTGGIQVNGILGLAFHL